jgi:peptidoglycan-associated lipoprotein
MKELRILFRSSVYTSVLIMAFGCGSSKQTVTPQPDPFPTAEEEITAQPETTPVEEVKEPEPVIEDTAPKVALVLSTVFFEYDKADLTAEARARLAENARQLQVHPEVQILIEGHCDERGTVEYNLALGERRAQATRSYLTNFGIRPNRIRIVSYGKEKPLDFGHSAQAWAKNRRAEFIKTN